jgi:hypothetical protein
MKLGEWTGINTNDLHQMRALLGNAGISVDEKGRVSAIDALQCYDEMANLLNVVKKQMTEFVNMDKSDPRALAEMEGKMEALVLHMSFRLNGTVRPVKETTLEEKGGAVINLLERLKEKNKPNEKNIEKATTNIKSLLQ